MISFWIYFGAYSLGCVLTLVFFLIGRTPALNERDWPWPVIFLWPLLVFWPIHTLAGLFMKRKMRRKE